MGSNIPPLSLSPRNPVTDKNSTMDEIPLLPQLSDSDSDSLSSRTGMDSLSIKARIFQILESGFHNMSEQIRGILEGVEEDGKMEQEEEKPIKEVPLYISKMTASFKPKKHTMIMVESSYDDLAAKIHRAWSEWAEEDEYEDPPDVLNSWEGKLEFETEEGSTIQTSLPWVEFKKQLGAIQVGVLY